MKLGFIGLGNIGLPAAINLLRRGYEVVGFDIHPNDSFVAAGGVAAKALQELATCNVILQSLPSGEALEQTIDALLPSVFPGQIFIDLSSYSLDVKRAQAQRLEQKGARMFDCEVSGLPHQVATRTAVLFKAGDQKAIRQCDAIFDALADKHFYLGPFGAATKMKLIANVMVCVHDLMAAEALNLGRALGLDPGTMVEVLSSSAAGSATFSNKAPLMVSREFPSGRGPFRHMFGYLDRAHALAAELSMIEATPLLCRVREVFAIARKEGRHDQDIAAIIEIVEAMKDKGALHD